MSFIRYDFIVIVMTKSGDFAEFSELRSGPDSTHNLIWCQGACSQK